LFFSLNKTTSVSLSVVDTISQTRRSLVLAFCGLTVGSEMHGSVAWLHRIVDLLDCRGSGAPRHWVCLVSVEYCIESAGEGESFDWFLVLDNESKS
jgi:hypothetical protein